MSYRIERVNELIKEQLTELIHADFPDEIVSINFINTASDLSQSKIFFSVVSERATTYKEVISCSWKYWKAMSKKIKIRRLPKLILIKDEMKSDIDRIEELIEKKDAR
jgi:ribosome-binding factor A